MKALPYTLMSGAGNLFAMVDGFAETVPDDASRIARELCGAHAREHGGATPDGMIVVERARDAASAMRIYNLDGSRAEACGNGLRCAAKLAADRGYTDGDAFTVRTDAGVRACRVERDDGCVERTDGGVESARGSGERARGRVIHAHVEMGRPRVAALDERLEVDGRSITVAIVDMGNPHCVLLVDDERTAAVRSLGPALERHPRFERGTNVGFLALRDGGAYLRVWERGVGETLACGSGACAAAFVAVAKERLAWPVRLCLPGGELGVTCDARGVLTLSGPTEEQGTYSWSPADGGAHAPHGGDRTRDAIRATPPREGARADGSRGAAGADLDRPSPAPERDRARGRRS